jgi:predicted nucleotidyltransferase component of viral defense system
MNLFDKLVTEALRNQPSLSPLRIVVEKELLHHDILRVLRDNDLLQNLTFIGGTCLRACYGGVRLSEDLDFTGGSDFTKDTLSSMGEVLIKDLQAKYGLQVSISEPAKEEGNVETWKIKIETRPEQKHLPAQLINIDICALPSYERRPMMLQNPYGLDMGTSGLIIQAQSREEIYTDKLIAFAFRPNRIKYRDLWDIMWLHERAVSPRIEWITDKLRDRNHTQEHFFSSFAKRLKITKESGKIESEFKREMMRFLPTNQMDKALGQGGLWDFIVYLLEDLEKEIHRNLNK